MLRSFFAKGATFRGLNSSTSLFGALASVRGAKSKAGKARKAAIASAGSRGDALTLALSHIDQTFGRGSIMRLGSPGAPGGEPQPVISSGSLLVDAATGVGGFPRGRVTEVFGPESSGKTTLALHAVAACQAGGGTACFIDAENALDARYAARLGVRLDDLLVSQPDYGEQALEIADTLVRSGSVDLIVVDSVAALVPRAELEGGMGDVHMGLQARMMSQALRKITASLGRSPAAVIFLNQIRMKIGVMFGSPETTPGGQALRFFSSLRMDVRRTGKVSRGDEQVGTQVRVRVVKNKIAPPFREALVDVYFASGIDGAAELLTVALDTGIVTKSGSWYSADGKALGQGRDSAARAIEEDEALVKRIRDRAAEAGAAELAPFADADNDDGAAEAAEAAEAPATEGDADADTAVSAAVDEKGSAKGSETDGGNGGDAKNKE